MEIDKRVLYDKCLTILEDKIKSLQESLNSVTDAVNSETKSTAGDKHETGRAMMQLEQEKLSAQLNDAINQKDDFCRIDIHAVSKFIVKGSLVYTNKSILFISAPIGKVMLDDEIVFAISTDSPLGKKLLGRKENDKIEVNGTVYLIRSVK
jgi:transcription elongation GreA/GreB family factor